MTQHELDAIADTILAIDRQSRPLESSLEAADRQRQEYPHDRPPSREWTADELRRLDEALTGKAAF